MSLNEEIKSTYFFSTYMTHEKYVSYQHMAKGR